MCGILGIYGYQSVASELIYGLTALQHRGQDSAGIVTLADNFRIRKGLGHVTQVFSQADIATLKGDCGLGHVRYATIGTPDILNAQPFAVNYPFGLAMVHNGNVINFTELRKSLRPDYCRQLETSNDVALILYAFAEELERKNLKQRAARDIFDTVQTIQERVLGAYSAIAIIANQGFLAFRDPCGIRPLVMAKNNTEQGVVYAFASETTCFDYLGYEVIRDLEPGEAIFIDTHHQVHSRVCVQKKPAFCVFEYIYFAREDSIVLNRLVASERVKMGKALAKTFKATGLEPDIVIDVPSSAYYFASGLAEELQIPYRRGLAKNHHMDRSFIMSSQRQRERCVRQKINPIRDVLRGKKIAVVDDSIVRGTTSKHLVKLIKEMGAKEVYFISASPPIKYPCVYGIDMSIKREIIAAHYDVADIGRYIGAEAVIYQSLPDLKKLYSDTPMCYACFSGEYPTDVSETILEEIEREKLCSNRI